MSQTVVELLEVSGSDDELHREDLEVSGFNAAWKFEERAIATDQRQEGLALCRVELDLVCAWPVKDGEPTRYHRGFDAQDVIDRENELSGENQPVEGGGFGHCMRTYRERAISSGAVDLQDDRVKRNAGE